MSSFTLELEISFSKKLLTAYKSDPKLEAGSIRTLEKKLDTAIVIRNTAKGEALKRFPDGTRVQRDMYSGFLVFCTAEDLKHIDRDLCIRNYQKFKRLHDQEVERLRKENKKALRWYIA